MNISDLLEEDENDDMDVAVLSMGNLSEGKMTGLNNLEAEVINSTLEGKPEKRPREQGEESEDCDEGYTTVIRRRPKKLLRSDSSIEEEGKFEVCITSLEVLPKQMAFAKLLRDLNIQNITNIKYRNPYKVLIKFNKREQAEKLVVNKKIMELNARCQFTDEVNLCYGIIRGIELEYSEKDIQDTLKSSHEIISVRRLKRSSSEGKWEDSETIRVSFKAESIPSYVYAYGCRLAVENYVFPVTQCSACWKFGHIKKFCPLNKIICPKCGLNHENCEVDTYKCPNCKGPHMALDKKCPMFIKEKEIRNLMTEESVTYRKALQIYLEKNAKISNTNSNSDANINTNNIHFESIKSVSVIQQEESSDDLNSEKEQEVNTKTIPTPQTNQKKKHKKSNKGISSKKQTEKKEEDSNIGPNTLEKSWDGETKERKKSFEFRRLWLKLKQIIMSTGKFEDKMELVFEIMLEECKLFIVNLFDDRCTFKKLFSVFNG